MELKKLTEDEISSAISSAVKNAVDFIESEIAPDRIKAQRYFDGESRLSHEEGRSKVVATKCRDTIRAVKPSLMRVFLQSGTPVEFMPRRPETVQAAEQATKYAEYVFERNDGFSILSDVFHDALIKKVGIAKVYYDEVDEVEFDEYSGITDDQIALISQDEDTEIIEQTITIEGFIDENGMQVEPSSYDIKVSHTKKDGQIKIKSIAPEDFFVDRDAVSIKDCYVCGHSSEGRVGDLVAMGFDFDEVYNLAGVSDSTVADEEEMARRGWSDMSETDSSIDASMRRILITEAYMKMDIEGVGVPKMYKFLCAGQDYKVLDYELCDYIPFAVFEVDPEPHTFFGRSLVDIIMDDQDASTSLLRGLLDNISMMNNPRLIVNEDMVNLDDVLNNEIGGIIRAKDINQIREVIVGSAASTSLPAMSYYDEAIRAKTGVSGASMGMDTDVLQSQTAAGVNAAVQAASAVSELIARTLAEGGMKQMFHIIAQLARQHPNKDEIIRVDGQFVPVDPSSWGTEIDIVANVGLGNNKHAEKLMTLQNALQLQMQIYQGYGSQNGLVTLTNVRNTVSDIMKLGGIANADRYIMPMTVEIEQQMRQQQAEIAQQQAQNQQGQPTDPNMAFMQTEQMKTQTRAQVDMQKAMMENQRKMHEISMKDDLDRDQMAQDLLVDAAKVVGQYGTNVDVARIKAEQNAPRPHNMQMMGINPNG
jgi:hypothetical protein